MFSLTQDAAPAKRRKPDFFKFFFRLLAIPGWNLTLVRSTEILFLRAGNGEGDGTCCVKHKELMAELHLSSRPHLVALIQRLQDLGGVKVLKRGKHGNLYQVLHWKAISERREMSAKPDIKMSAKSAIPI